MFYLSIREVTGLSLAVMFLVVASIMTMNRKEGYDTRFRSYSDLYNMNDFPQISGFEIHEGGKLSVEIENLKTNSWKISAEGDAPYVRQGSDLVIDLLQGFNTYVALPEGEGATVQLSVAWTPGKERPLVSNVSLPVRRSLPYSLEDFVFEVDKLTEDQMARASALINDAGIKASDTAEEKVLKLSLYLHRSLSKHRGGPSSHMKRLNGLQQYEEALAGRSKVYCENNAEIFAFLATVAGVPTRVVSVGGAFDGVALGAHVFSESYLPDENHWAYVDVELGIGLVREVDGEVLNGADILHRNASDSSAGLMASVLTSDGISERPYKEVMPSIQKFVSGEHNLIYLWSSLDRFSPAQRIARFIYKPQPGYSRENIDIDARVRLLFTYLPLVIFFSILANRSFSTYRNRKFSQSDRNTVGRA